MPCSLGSEIKGVNRMPDFIVDCLLHLGSYNLPCLISPLLQSGSTEILNA